jgi:Methyltransferase domain
VGIDLSSANLTVLANQVVRPGMFILEIGSWIGDASTVELATVAKENNGHLVCLDWWKGSKSVLQGPHVMQESGWRNVFNTFLDGMQRRGFENTIMPIRADTKISTTILRDNLFDFIYIDGEHSFDSVYRDILQSVRLIRNGGILTGHDCDQILTPENEEFVHQHLDEDMIGGMHTGVTLAVGLLVPDSVVSNRVWRKVMTTEAKEEVIRRSELKGGG